MTIPAQQPPSLELDLSAPAPVEEPQPRRRSRKTVALAAVLTVLVVAAIAVPVGLLVQTRGVLDWQKGQTRKVQAQLDTTNVTLAKVRDDLASVQAELSLTKGQLDQANSDLAAAKSRLGATVSLAAQEGVVADDLHTCLMSVMQGALDAFTWNESRNAQCTQALDAYRDLPVTGLSSLTSTT